MRKEYSIILVIINNFTKYFHIILFKKIYIKKQLGTMILTKFMQYYKILK